MNRSMFQLLMCLPVLPSVLLGQDQRPTWERRAGATESPVVVFHSTQSANLPTAATLARGEFLFEISHRFSPPVSAGADALWGLDGPVTNRLGLAYAVTDRAMVGLLRSNLRDNLELQVKLRLAEGGRESMAYMIGAVGGAAINPELPEVGAFDGHSVQSYAQLILNVAPVEDLALGVVPAYLSNVDPESGDTEGAFSLGLNAQVYLSPQVSLFGEWSVGEDHGVELSHDAGTLGLELETGGHFFKLLVSNTVRLNPAQFMGGTPFAFEPDEWRLGFNVTRLLTL